MRLTVSLDTWVIIHRNILQNFRAKYKPLTVRANTDDQSKIQATDH